jgi:hypothetical protein
MPGHGADPVGLRPLRRKRKQTARILDVREEARPARSLAMGEEATAGVACPWRRRRWSARRLAVADEEAAGAAWPWRRRRRPARCLAVADEEAVGSTPSRGGGGGGRSGTNAVQPPP